MNIILAYLPYAFINAYTPGPNNILCLNSVSRGGLRKGKTTLFGIAAGFLLVMGITAAVCLELSKVLPQVTFVMKYIGAAYILWLAIHILRSKSFESTDNSSSDFWRSFLLQFMNVKIILYAITIYTGYVLPYSSSKLLLGTSVVCNTLIGISGCITWALAGHFLQKQYRKHYRLMNVIMALVLIWSAVQLIL
jgi:cysteine/O-acetylserine efflux protein